MNTPHTSFQVTDLTFSAGQVAAGRSGVMVVTARGPIGRPDILITSWEQFKQYYGGLLNGNDGPLLCKRALDRGTALRISRIEHYTDATDDSTGTAVKAVEITNTQDASNNVLFELPAKYPGADYNNIKRTITAGSNGKAGYFDLQIEMVGEPSTIELYRNLKIIGKPTVVDSKYLDTVKAQSRLVDVVYHDLSAIVASSVVPANGSSLYHNGTNGASIVAADYIGASGSKVGFHAFDGIDDIMQIAILDDLSDLNGVAEAGDAYAAARGDLQYFHHLYSITEASLVTERDALNIVGNNTMFFAGGISVVDPLTSETRTISELGDVLGIAAYSEVKVGAWYSFSGPNRGIVTNCLGSGNKFGAPGNLGNLQLLANRQINVVVDRNKKTQLLGCFTAQIDDSQLALGSIKRFTIYLKKSLGPIIESYLEEPNDILTWKKLYMQIKPFMDNLVSSRAMYSYQWYGDQFANSMDDLVVNNSADVTLGKYKVKLVIKAIAPLQEIEIGIALTPSGVSFEDALASAQ